MNFEEYEQKLKELKDEFNQKELDLRRELVAANSPYKIGDKVTDHIGTIVIEKMGCGWGYSNKPCATYFGIELKKDGTPNKKGNKRMVWQCNLINS
jgi:hypothetical protein